MIGLISFLTFIAYNRFAVSSKKPSKEIVDSAIKRLPSDANYLEFPTPTEAAVVETDSYTFMLNN